MADRDEIALKSAKKIAAMWGHNRGHLLAKYQVEILHAIALASLPASKEAEADKPVHEWLPTYGKVKFKDLGRDVNDATYAKRDDFDFGDSYPGHVILPTMNFNSLNRIVSKYAERPAPTATGVSEAMVERAVQTAHGIWHGLTGHRCYTPHFDKVIRAALEAALTTESK